MPSAIGTGAFSIDAFRANFANAARQYLFYVGLNIPVSGISTTKAMYLVRSASIPAKSVEKKEIAWQGYRMPFGGVTTHEDWTVTFMVDPKAQIHQAMVNWSNLVHDPATNIHGLPSSYMADQRVQLLTPTTGSTSITEVKLIGAWPQNVGPIELNYDNTEIATFQVTFSYVRHEYVY